MEPRITKVIHELLHSPPENLIAVRTMNLPSGTMMVDRAGEAQAALHAARKAFDESVWLSGRAPKEAMLWVLVWLDDVSESWVMKKRRNMICARILVIVMVFTLMITLNT